jgi:hypothetical protein
LVCCKEKSGRPGMAARAHTHTQTDGGCFFSKSLNVFRLGI